jgi:hypothetical protein
MFNLSDQILHDLAQDSTPGALREKLTTMAASVEEDAFVKLVAREITVNEINLAAEQNYLVEAARFYQDMECIQIP